jgi:uncharacterized protein YjeT (DUF2065 family)
MPVDFSTLIDTLLVLAGLVLVATGLVMFIYSKTSTQASSVEAFGIKLNVTHPSLILVLAGVGLMLAPRLLPGLPGQPDKPEPAAVAEAPRPQAVAPAAPPAPEPASQATRTPTPIPAETKAAAPPARPAIKPAGVPPATLPSTSVAQATRPATPAKPPSVAPAPKKPTPQIAAVRPAPAAAVTAEAPASKPSAAAKPARPILAYAALALPISRSFWSGETRTSYTRRLHTTLQQAGRDVLHMEARGLELGQSAFDAWWNESSQHPRSRELCSAPHAPRALLGARVETPTTISSIESAYWPELKLRLFVCANQRIYRQQKTLSPQNEDAWPFATELNIEVERFLRAYRGDLAGE